MDWGYYFIRYFVWIILALCLVFFIVLKRRWFIEKLKWIDDTFLNPGSYFMVEMCVGNQEFICFLQKKVDKDFSYEWKKLIHKASKVYWKNGRWTVIATPDNFDGLDLECFDGDQQVDYCNRVMRLKLNDLFEIEDVMGLTEYLIIGAIILAGIGAWFGYQHDGSLKAISASIDVLIKALVK